MCGDGAIGQQAAQFGTLCHSRRGASRDLVGDLKDRMDGLKLMEWLRSSSERLWNKNGMSRWSSGRNPQAGGLRLDSGSDAV